MARLQYRPRKFAANFILNGGNGVKAVYAAGYIQGYNSARVTASRLLSKANVLKMIEQHAKKAQLSADQVIEELSEVAQVKADIDANQKLKALELLGKFHKLFTDKVETTSTTEQSHIVEQTILKRSKRTGEDAETIALSLLESFAGEPEFLQPEHWGKFAYVLAKPLESKNKPDGTESVLR